MKKIILLIYYFIFILFAVHAQQKKDIQVKFILEEETYNQFYNDNERTNIESQCALQITDILNEDFPFFHFTTNGSDKKLFIYLTGKDKASTNKIHETGFKFHIPAETSENSDRKLYFTFRAIEDFKKELPVSSDLFIDEITSTFKTKLEQNKAEMVSTVLSRVEISDDYFVLIMNSNNGVKRLYIAPLNENEFRIARNSEFRIVTTLSFDIFANSDDIVDAKVISCIKNIESARTKYHLPVSYPERSLLMELTNTTNTTMTPVDTISKMVYLLNYLPLINTGMELASPSDISNNSN